MLNIFKSIFVFCFLRCCISRTEASLYTIERLEILNSFAGCNIRVINFRGSDIDFRIIKEPIILSRYISYCKTYHIYPAELASEYPELKSRSTCYNVTEPHLPPDLVSINFVAQTLTESFQTASKNRICEANIYLDPPSDQNSPQLYAYSTTWSRVLLNPILLHNTFAYPYWKQSFVDTVPTISLLICRSNLDSICRYEDDVKKWISGIFNFPEHLKLSVNVFIWEYPYSYLKTHCPYCDPCDSLKTIPVKMTAIPSSSNEMEKVLQQNERTQSDPKSFRITLVLYRNQFGSLRNREAVLKHIRWYPVENDLFWIYQSADQHLTSLLLPKLANITFSVDYGEDEKWEGVIIDSCSQTKPINSHPMFRPAIWRYAAQSLNFFQQIGLVTRIDRFNFVSCHRDQMHWAAQLKELVLTFDVATWSLILTSCFTVSWILKLTKNSSRLVTNFDVFYAMLDMIWSILDQSNPLFTTNSRNSKASFYFCIFLVPISWLYLSTLYKGENITRLTAEPPLVQFDNFKMLEDYQFHTYSRRYNLETFVNAKAYNISSLANFFKHYGNVIAHESLPFVSELWFELVNFLRPFSRLEHSLMFLKNEISNQMWKYINNSAMIPDYGKGDIEDVSTILNFHMSKCNKSAIIVRRNMALKIYGVLKLMKKPVFLGKEVVLERFFGYKFHGHFPSKFVFRARHLFETGVFEWWQKHIEYSFVLKINVHSKRLMAINQTDGSEIDGSKTAAMVLSLIPAFGLLLSTVLFLFTELSLKNIIQNVFSSLLAIYAHFTEKLSKLFNIT